MKAKYYKDEVLRAHQAAKKLTQKEIAETSGVGTTAVNQTLQGVNEDPQISTLFGIAKSLGLKLSEVVRDEADEVENQQAERMAS
jgi:transcriptional regulator with XRE-family HTH domain